MNYKTLKRVCALLLFISISSDNWSNAEDSTVLGHHFHAKNCQHINKDKNPVWLEYLQVEPDPVRLGQSISIKTNFSLTRDIGANGTQIEADFSIELRTPDRHPVDLCYIVGESMCHYNNLCDLLQHFKDSQTCPENIKQYGSDCGCPIKKGYYNISIAFPTKTLPFILRGSFDVTISVQERGCHLGCIVVHFCLEKCKPWTDYEPYNL